MEALYLSSDHPSSEDQDAFSKAYSAFPPRRLWPSWAAHLPPHIWDKWGAKRPCPVSHSRRPRPPELVIRMGPPSPQLNHPLLSLLLRHLSPTRLDQMLRPLTSRPVFGDWTTSLLARPFSPPKASPFLQTCALFLEMQHSLLCPVP